MTNIMLLRKAAATVMALFAGTGLVLLVSTTGMAQAYNSSSVTVGTVPQCVWGLSNVSDAIALTHDSADGHTKYVGAEFNLSGASSASANIFVGNGVATSAVTGVDNCSWYGSTATAQSGASVQMALTTETMTATSSTHSGDHSLSYHLDGSSSGENTRSMYVTLTPSACENAKSDAGNSTSSWTTASGTTAVDTHTSPMSIAKLIASHTTTTSTCTFSTALKTYIPIGLLPANPADTYNFVGPTLTSTLVSAGVLS